MRVSFDCPSWLTQDVISDAGIMPATEVPNPRRRWVKLQQSVTATIEALLRRLIAITVHFSGICRLLPWEMQLPTDQIRTRCDGFARHISMQVDGTPLLMNSGDFGRVCVWQDERSSDHRAVEEFCMPALLEGAKGC